MAEHEPVEGELETAEELERNYKPPPERSLEEIISSDPHDQSLQKYKEMLLGEAKEGSVIVDPSDERRVIVKRLALCVEGRPDMELDLTKDLDKLKQQVFVIKEGISYRIRIDFIVQREIVHGLKYVQKTYRKMVPGVEVDKMSQMVGSYPPKSDLQSFLTPLEEAPSGLLSRGSYTVHSHFTDDDSNTHLKWEWCFEIKKDWAD